MKRIQKLFDQTLVAEGVDAAARFLIHAVLGEWHRLHSEDRRTDAEILSEMTFTLNGVPQ